MRISPVDVGLDEAPSCRTAYLSPCDFDTRAVCFTRFSPGGGNMPSTYRIVGLLIVLFAWSASGCKDKPANLTPDSEEPIAAASEEDQPAPLTKKAGSKFRPARLSAVPSHPPAAAPETPPGSEPVKPTPPPPTAPIISPVPTVPSAKRPIPDPRLLLNAEDLAALAGKQTFHRAALPGAKIGDDADALYFEPDNSTTFGLGIQLFRTKDTQSLKDRFGQMMASYPSAVDITPFPSKAFFAYWGDVLFLGFTHTDRSLAVVLSCGRKFCDSEELYRLAKTVHSRIN